MIVQSDATTIIEKKQIIIIIFYFYFTWALNVAGLILCFRPASTGKPFLRNASPASFKDFFSIVNFIVLFTSASYSSLFQGNTCFGNFYHKIIFLGLCFCVIFLIKNSPISTF